MFFYTATASLGGAITIFFIPVAVLVANAYGVNVMLVNMCSISYMATYIPISFLVIWMFKNMNSAIVFRIGIAMALCGTWLR